MPGRPRLRSEPPLGGWPGLARAAGALTQPQPGRCPPSRAWAAPPAPSAPRRHAPQGAIGCRPGLGAGRAGAPGAHGRPRQVRTAGVSWDPSQRRLRAGAQQGRQCRGFARVGRRPRRQPAGRRRRICWLRSRRAPPSPAAAAARGSAGPPEAGTPLQGGAAPRARFGRRERAVRAPAGSSSLGLPGWEPRRAPRCCSPSYAVGLWALNLDERGVQEVALLSRPLSIWGPRPLSAERDLRRLSCN